MAWRCMESETHLHDLDRHAVAIRDSRDLRLRHAGGRVGDDDAVLAQVRDTRGEVVGLDADVQDARGLIGRDRQQLDERVARDLQIRDPHGAVRITDRERFLGAERVAIERERCVIIPRADADVIETASSAILRDARLNERPSHDQPAEKPDRTSHRNLLVVDARVDRRRQRLRYARRRQTATVARIRGAE